MYKTMIFAYSFVSAFIPDYQLGNQYNWRFSGMYEYVLQLEILSLRQTLFEVQGSLWKRRVGCVFRFAFVVTVG
jgi:hypothetical protein